MVNSDKSSCSFKVTESRDFLGFGVRAEELRRKLRKRMYMDDLFKKKKISIGLWIETQRTFLSCELLLNGQSCFSSNVLLLPTRDQANYL